MARKFMYCCFGLLALVFAFEFGASSVGAQAMGFRVLGPGVISVGDAVYSLATVSEPLGWRQLPDGNFTLPPVPGSSLVHYSSGQLAVTESGEGWGKVNGVWTNLGPIPGTPIQDVSWGQVKTKYRR